MAKEQSNSTKSENGAAVHTSVRDGRKYVKSSDLIRQEKVKDQMDKLDRAISTSSR